MRWIKTGNKTAAIMILATALSFSVLAASAFGEGGPEIGVTLAAGVVLTNGDTRNLNDLYFKAEVIARTGEALPFDTVELETPIGEILELEASEDKTAFFLASHYETARLYWLEHGREGGEYRIVFNRDDESEDVLALDYPFTAFFEDYAHILQPVHMHTYVPLQLVVNWELVRQWPWREYDGIIVELDDTEAERVRLYTSELLSTRETLLDIEKEYAILETDTVHALTVKIMNEKTEEAETIENAVAADYTMSYTIANEIEFITTPDYYLGDSSDGTSCFIGSAIFGR